MLTCRIRRKEVAALPEEQVRQALLALLIDELGYRTELIAVELALRTLPLAAELPPKRLHRRADLICFTPGTLTPHLLVECKAVPLRRKMVGQLLGYNYYLRAPHVALVNQEHAVILCYNPSTNDYEERSTFPPPP